MLLYESPLHSALAFFGRRQEPATPATPSRKPDAPKPSKSKVELASDTSTAAKQVPLCDGGAACSELVVSCWA